MPVENGLHTPQRVARHRTTEFAVGLAKFSLLSQAASFPMQLARCLPYVSL